MFYNMLATAMLAGNRMDESAIWEKNCMATRKSHVFFSITELGTELARLYMC